MLGHTFFQQPPLPLVQGDLVHGRGDAIPQALDVVDLVFDWKLVETRRRDWKPIRHS